MKRLLCLLFPICFLLGCGNNTDGIDSAFDLRQSLLRATGCAFVAEITADYGDDLYQFTVQCQGDNQGNLTFSVLAPDSISGIKGRITEAGGHLIFDGAALAFPPITDEQITPVCAPWILLKTLRSGYIASCAEGDTLTYLQIDDSYREKALHLDIWLDQSNLPVQAEILWDGRRILSLKVKEFAIV